jgi:hypothetical protein
MDEPTEVQIALIRQYAAGMAEIRRENAALEVENEQLRSALRQITDLWRRGFVEASWGHGSKCNIHTREKPGTGCTCVFGLLNVAVDTALTDPHG